MSAANILPWASLLLGTGGFGFGLLNFFKELVTGSAAARSRDHDTWTADFEKIHERLEKQCEQCNRKLERVLNALYRLLEDLDDQIFPMLQLPKTDLTATRLALRTLIRNTRDVLVDREAS